MNKAPWIVVGVLFALGLSWVGMVYGPARQLGAQAPETSADGRFTYPKPPVGEVAQGAQVYRAQGCYYCHTQQVGGGEFAFDVRLTQVGDDRDATLAYLEQVELDATKLDIVRQAFVVKALVAAYDAQKAANDAAGKAEDEKAKAAAAKSQQDAEAALTTAREGVKKNLDGDANRSALALAGVVPGGNPDEPNSADLAAKDLGLDAGKVTQTGAPLSFYEDQKTWPKIKMLVRGFKAVSLQSKLQPVASDWPDLHRGRGQRQSVARDYLFASPAMPGLLRIGPDLAHVGNSVKQKGENWHYRHLYDPKSVVKKSPMPPYTYLFKVIELSEGAPLPEGALVNEQGKSIRPGHAVLPRPDARRLMAYLRSLRVDQDLPEAPRVQLASENENRD